MTDTKTYTFCETINAITLTTEHEKRVGLARFGEWLDSLHKKDKATMLEFCTRVNKINNLLSLCQSWINLTPDTLAKLNKQLEEETEENVRADLYLRSHDDYLNYKQLLLVNIADAFIVDDKQLIYLMPATEELLESFRDRRVVLVLAFNDDNSDLIVDVVSSDGFVLSSYADISSELLEDITKCVKNMVFRAYYDTQSHLNILDALLREVVQ